MKRDSSKKASPLLAKGQRTLEELKNGIVVMKKQQQQQQQHTEAGAPAATPPLNADSTKMSLLDRIRYKQLRQSLDAPPPSPAELARRAALQRAGDVAAVVAMLSAATATGQKRVSFTMATLQARLKDSLRVPISKEEGAACVRLLAKEIAPRLAEDRGDRSPGERGAPDGLHAEQDGHPGACRCCLHVKTGATH